jgi:hypothetical protein
VVLRLPARPLRVTVTAPPGAGVRPRAAVWRVAVPVRGPARVGRVR